MKTPRSQEPTRWRERGADIHALESRAAVLADAASQVQPLAPQALSRIRSQVVAQRPRRGLLAFFGLPARTRLAFGLGLIVVCATTAGGARVLWRKYVGSMRKAAPPPAETTPRSAPRLTSRVTAPTKEPEAPLPAMDEAPAPGDDREATRVLPRVGAPVHPNAKPAPPVAIEPRPVESPDPTPAPAEAPVPAPPARATEAALVAEALFALRQRDDPRAALSTLDRYAREFPHGVLETEALRTRIEAVVQLGDLKTALVLLDGKAARADALGANLTLTRAELRASAGRFREALSDFTQVLDSPSGPLAAGGDERALYGRAVSLGRLGQSERARADLLAYQKRFPGGRFAVEVERLLAGKEPSQRPRP
jgi:tetratricopeptide repeat protein